LNKKGGDSMAVDLGLAASHITAALISSSAVSVKGKSTQESAENAVSVYSMVLAKLTDRDRAGKL
jgi:hypothetical protein